MKQIVKFFQVIYVIYAALLFLVLMLLILPLAIIGSFFGTIRGGTIIYSLCTIWAETWLFLIGIHHKNIYIAPHNKDHACIFVANHISYMDVPVLVKSIRQPMRVLAKSELSRVPVFGFLYKRATVMVDRSDGQNRAKSVMRLKAYLKRKISIFIFPEGTFNITGQPLKEFYNGAFRVAIETQTPIKPVIFPDTIDRWHYNDFFSLTPGVSRAIFMEEIPVKDLTLHDIDILKEKVYRQMDAELRMWRKFDSEIEEDIITK
jgi:1-acyl-sn-glycerol-3-phosphate acyltransferase